MKFVAIIGPQAVGKMAVGEELARMTGLKLFHNHMTIDLVSNFFSYGSEQGKRLVHSFRRQLMEEVAKSDLPGLIFTYIWAFNMTGDGDYLKEFADIFAAQGADLYLVELEAALEERLVRNRTPLRLERKPTKRNLEWSDRDLLQSMEKYRMNSLPGEVDDWPNYLRIDNTSLSPTEAASRICREFGFAALPETQ